MANDALPEEWEILREWLPEDLDARARQHQFFQRERGLTDGERWLRLILMHVAGGLSLEQTALRARELGLAQIAVSRCSNACVRPKAGCRTFASTYWTNNRGAWDGESGRAPIGCAP